jgi:hypothetical protein
MHKLKRASVILLLLPLLFSVAVPLIIMSNASAITPTDPGGGGGTATPTIADQVFSYQAYIYISYSNSTYTCAGHSNGDTRTRYANDIAPGDATAGHWFNGGSTTRSGTVLAPDGQADCNNGNGWLAKAMNMWGFGNDYGSFLCAIGYQQNASPVTSAGCTSMGSGDGGFQKGSTFSTNKVASTIRTAAFNGGTPSLSPAMRYYLYMQNFLVGCGATAQGPWASATANQKTGDLVYHIQLVSADGKSVVDTLFKGTKGHSTNITIGEQVESGRDELSCGDLEKKLQDVALANAYAAQVIANPANGAALTNTSSGTGGSGGYTCPLATDAPMQWLMCPLIGMGTQAVEWMQALIQNFLYTPISQIFDNAGFKQIANTFRNLGIGIVIIAGLVMVIAQATGMEFVDAYTVRKVLPRLAVALIGMALAWPILQFVVTFFNDLGLWASSLINAAVIVPAGAGTAVSTPLHVIETIVGFGGTIAVGGLLLGPMGLLSMLATIILALLVGLLVLAVRQMVILVAVIIAPLAIAAYVLPGTQKLWHFWRETFITSLAMFPIIMLFLASGKALATVLGAVGSTEMTFLAVIVYFAPFFLLPFAFKLAGGLMSTIFAVANDRGRGGFDRLKKGRQASGAAHRERTIGRRVLQQRAKINDNFQGHASSGNRFKKAAFRGLSRGVAGYNIEGQMSTRRATVGKEVTDQINSGKDGEVRGLTATKQADGTWMSLGGATISEAEVMRGRQRWGNDMFAQQAALSYEMRKATDETQVSNLKNNYPALAKSWGMSTGPNGQANGAWIGAAFENQNQHLEYKQMRIHGGAGPGGEAMSMNAEGYQKFVGEVYNQRGSYGMSQMGSNTIKEIDDGYASADTDTQKRVQSVAETFMSRYGGGGGRIAGEAEGGAPIIQQDPAQMAAQAAAAGGARGGYQPEANYQTNTQGAGAVAERVRQLAVNAGVYRPLAPETDIHPTTGPSDNPRQN